MIQPKIIEQSKYSLSDSNNELIKVNTNKLISKFKSDSPDFYISPNSMSKSDNERIKTSIDFINNYNTDSRFLNKKTGNRNPDLIMKFEAPIIYFHNGKLGVKDGRHRIIAMKLAGYDEMYIEVPKEQINLCNGLK